MSMGIWLKTHEQHAQLALEKTHAACDMHVTTIASDTIVDEFENS